MIRNVSVALGLSLSPILFQARSIDGPNILPPPAGPFRIGRISYHWVDSSRAEFLDAAAAPRRELMVDVWYPAELDPRGQPASYLPDLPDLRRFLSDSVLRREYAPAYSAIEAGVLRTHAVEGARTRCPTRGCPLLIFSHGGGVDRSFYTAQYEDLASHGYVVGVIAHTYDTHLVVFPDGRAVFAAPGFRDTLPPDSTLPRWRRDLQRERRSEAYVRRGIDVEVADIRFVIDQVREYARNPQLRAPFLRQINLERIGALGHSAGGEAAAFACQFDRRLKACLNQDGVMHNLPFARDTRGQTMTQPFMFIGRHSRPPQLSDRELVAMEMTRAEADSLIRAIAAGQNDLLADMPGGAYRITLTVPNVTHMSFSDEPLIEAAQDSAKTDDALLALTVVERYTRAFFDKTLLGRAEPLLDRPAPADAALATVERFAPTGERKRP